MLHALGCASGRDSGAEVVDSALLVDTADTGTADTADSAAPAPVGTCPEGMVPVPPEAPLYCIDAYEVNEGTQSLSGATPYTAVTFYEAVAACEAVPVIDEAGSVIGYKRLATDAEWQDAADGTPGEGGWAYPYGDSPVEGICILPDDDGTLRYEELQLTGSAPGCVSSFGVYDQVGNAWEWVDPAAWSDSEAWLAMARSAGRDLRVGDDDRLYSLDADLSWIRYLGVTVGGMVPVAGAEGELSIDAYGVDLPNDMFMAGYLDTGIGPALAEQLLPVTLVEESDQQLAIYLDRARDGEPFTSKRGCAYYTGSAHACSNQAVSHEHPPDFDGTIGFRCASDPIPPAD